MTPSVQTIITPPVRLEEVIISDLGRAGTGRDGDPIRPVFQIFSKAGVLLAERDEFNSFSKKQLIAFAEFVREVEHNDIERAFGSWIDSIYGGH